MSLMFFGSQLCGGHCAIDISIASTVTGNLRSGGISIAHILSKEVSDTTFSHLPPRLPSASSNVCDTCIRPQLYTWMNDIASNDPEKHVAVMKPAE